MQQDWIYTEVGKRVLGYALDPRPVWFWNGDGSELIWRNLAAKLFRSKFKKKGLKFLPDPVPLKGQVTRLIRLGNDGRASVSRMRFQMGKKPVSATCSCVPLKTEDGSKGLLVISTDSVDFGLFDGDAFALVADEQLFSPAQDYVIINAEREIVAGATSSGDADELQNVLALPFEALSAASRLDVSLKAGASLLMLDLGQLSPTDEPVPTQPIISDDVNATDSAIPTEIDADVQTSAEPTVKDTPLPEGNEFDGAQADEEQALLEPTAEEQSEVEDDAYDMAHLDTMDAPTDQTEETRAQSEDNASEEQAETDDGLSAPSALTDLIDHLYKSGGNITTSELDDADLLAQNRIDAEVDFADDALADIETLPEAEIDQLSTPLEEVRNEMAALDNGEAEQEETSLWSISASEVTRDVETTTSSAINQDEDKTSKYNFDELSRILRERVNTEETRKSTKSPKKQKDETKEASEREAGKVISMTPKPPVAPNGKSSLVALSDEALVLNKLPLGILIFKDQTVLFANRSMADLAGYNTTNDLRDAGLDEILPRADDAGNEFGPVAKILRQDGESVDVVARLQTTIWHGQNAYMLTAREEPSTRPSNGIISQGRDGAQIDFGKISAALGQGCIQLNRAGYVLDLDARGSQLFGPSIDLLRNRPILEYVSTDTRSAYLSVLSGDAETGTIKVFAGAEHCEIKLFLQDIEDQSSSIFGLVTKVHADQEQIDHQKDELNSILPILSREIRRPLASIAGFNSLMKDEAYGAIENDRYKEYIADIHAATRQIEQVIGEIDDLSRLNIGEIELTNNHIDLGLMLNRCIVRIRGQANAQQVFVRSAIPETSYFVEADEKLLTQTIMNLLASAVTLTPAGGNVVLSAVRDDKGDLMIHVRDMGEHGQNRHEQFIVYHEPVGDQEKPADFVRSGVGLSLTQALAKANAFSLSLDQIGRSGMLMELAIPADRVTGT
uniref:sensor histidine kinase n=1 Tax=uncultured Maritalea sp. TaxID=757249 RepID=UPI00260D9B28